MHAHTRAHTHAHTHARTYFLRKEKRSSKGRLIRAGPWVPGSHILKLKGFFVLRVGKVASRLVRGWARRSRKGKKHLQLHTASTETAQVSISLPLLPRRSPGTTTCCGLLSPLIQGTTDSGRAFWKSLALQQGHLLLPPNPSRGNGVFLTCLSQKHRLIKHGRKGQGSLKHPLHSCPDFRVRCSLLL